MLMIRLIRVKFSALQNRKGTLSHESRLQQLVKFGQPLSTVVKAVLIRKLNLINRYDKNEN